MTKSESLEAIEKAKNAHIKQMEKIEAALNGISVEHPTAVSKLKCDFGKWLYGENREALEHILGGLFYEELDKAHAEWHSEYAKLHALLFQEKKGGLLSRLFNANKVDTLSLDRAKAYFVELQKITKSLLLLLDKSQRRMSAVSESKFH